MASENLCLLSGIVTSDMVTTKNNAMCSFTFENSEVGRDGKLYKALVTVIAAQDLALMCVAKVTKGTKLYVEGRLQTKSKESMGNKKLYWTELVAHKIERMG